MKSLKFNTELQKAKALRTKGLIVTFKNIQSQSQRKQFIISKLEKSGEARKIHSSIAMSNWYNTEAELYEAIDWNFMESATQI